MIRPSYPTKAWELGAIARAAHEASGKVPLSANPFTIRWQRRGGPFDGEKLLFQNFTDPPKAVWVRCCPDCGLHIFDRRVDGGEKYRLDQESTDDDWLVYVFTDERLGVSGPVEREKVTA